MRNLKALARGHAHWRHYVAGLSALLLLLMTEAMASATLYQVIDAEAAAHGIDTELICAVIQQESAWNPSARSHAGAVGLMQIMPMTGRDACSLRAGELLDPCKNVSCGVSYLSTQLERFKDPGLALCAYNAGPHRVAEYKNSCPPYRETQNYRRKILANVKNKSEQQLCLKAKAKRVSCAANGSRAYRYPLSAKALADHQFVTGGYPPSYDIWWGLVCKAVDTIYDREVGAKFSGKPAATAAHRKTWIKVFNQTISDIRRDEVALYGEKQARSRRQIREAIINASGCNNRGS